MKRIFLALGSLALVAMLGIATIGHGVDAQDTATPETSDSTAVGGQTTETKESAKDAYLTALAANLGISASELQAAIDATNTELGVEGGFKGGRGDGDRGGHHAPRGGENGRGGMSGRGGNSWLRDIDPTDAAAFLGLTEEEFETQTEGTSFLEIAEANGKTTDEVRAFMIQQATAQIDERLQAASVAPAGAETADPATGGTSITGATEVPTAPASTPAETA